MFLYRFYKKSENVCSEFLHETDREIKRRKKNDT